MINSWGIKDFELEVNFKPEDRPIFCKPRPIPLAILEGLNDACEEGIGKGVWKPIDLDAYETLVVPVQKAICPGKKNAKIRICEAIQ